MVIWGIVGALTLAFAVHVVDEMPPGDGRTGRGLPRFVVDMADGIARIMTAIGIAIEIYPITPLLTAPLLADIATALTAFLLAYLIWDISEAVVKRLVWQWRHRTR